MKKTAKAILRICLVALILALGPIMLTSCYSTHVGHPHGAPPGQVKKYLGGGGGHPHGAPPGQVKKFFR